MTRMIPVDIHGLNLILGGGIPVLKRHAEYEESATLLVRGPPGSGKTILGTQLAGALARRLSEDAMSDVVYGCVELLPTELSAQHAGLKRLHLPERVILSPFAREPHTGRECRIYASLLDLTAGKEQAGIEEALEALLAQVGGAGGRPRVIVIDSLSDGYNLGASAPRILADALCKLAVEKGVILILLEETIDGRPSAWSFAVDVVIELQQRMESSAGAREREIIIRKNRFGPAEPGPHRANILPGSGYEIRPEPSTYISSTTSPRFVDGLRREPAPRDWGQRALDQENLDVDWPRLHDQTVAICGTDAFVTHRLADRIGRPLREGEVELAVDLHYLSENAKNVTRPEEHRPCNGRLTLGIGYPYLGGDRLIGLIVQALDDLASHGRIGRVVLGDTRSLRLFSSPEEMIQSLMILSTLLREAGIPLILFDSSAPEGPVGSALPHIADFADAVLTVRLAEDGSASISATYGSLHKRGWSMKLADL